MTDNDIIKALNDCLTKDKKEIYFITKENKISSLKIADTLDLINRQKVEIEEQDQAIVNALKCMGQIRDEVITEFAERLKEEAKSFCLGGAYNIFERKIDQVAKEMKEGVNNA